MVLKLKSTNPPPKFVTLTNLKKKLPKLILPISGIKIYSLPDVDSDEDEEYKLQV